MLVPSFQFLGFSVIFALLVNVSQRRIWRDLLMLAANICFLASFSRSPVTFAPFAAFILGGYVLLEAVRLRPRGLFWPVILIALVAFFWLKRYSFIPSILLLKSPYVAIGVSYITFRILHLLIDTGQGLLKERLRFLDYLNYTLCFPCIVAGPIQMFPDYLEGRTGRPNLSAIGSGLERIIIGMFKVFVVSSALDALHSETIGALLHGDRTLVQVLGVVVIYPIYLYFNFSGYTDVVIGVGRLLGQGLPENFDRPFVAANFIEFWSRWHITLSTWLRTYVYSPFMMQGMRRFPAPAMGTVLSVAAFFLTFFLVGAWHGQTSEFLFFGVLQGGGVAANKLYQVMMTSALGRKGYRQLGDQWAYRAICRGATFTWFGFTLLWFWSTWSALGQYWAAAGPTTAIAALLVMWALATIVLEAFVRVGELLSWATGGEAFWSSPYVRSAQTAAMTFATVLVVYVLSAPPPAIVYKAF